MENEDNLVIKMPTSAGKTLIAELSILNYFYALVIYGIIYLSQDMTNALSISKQILSQRESLAFIFKENILWITIYKEDVQ